MEEKKIFYVNEELPESEFNIRLKTAILMGKYMLPPCDEFPYWEYVGPWPEFK